MGLPAADSGEDGAGGGVMSVRSDGAQELRATRDRLVAGRLDLHRDGYGFVRPNGSADRERRSFYSAE